MSTPATAQAPAVIELRADQLEGPGVVFCPNPAMPLWSNHPRVYVDVAHVGQGQCPYCGTVYKLKAGEVFKGGH